MGSSLHSTIFPLTLLAFQILSMNAVADTSRNIGGGGGGFSTWHMYAFGVRLNESFKYNAWYIKLFNYCNVTITSYAYILVCFLVPLAPKQHKLWYLVPLFLQVKIIEGARAPLAPPPPPPRPSILHCMNAPWRAPSIILLFKARRFNLSSLVNKTKCWCSLFKLTSDNRL